MYRCIDVSMYLYRYPSKHGISGLAAGGAWEQFEGRQEMMIKWTRRYTPRLRSSEFGDVLEGSNSVYLEIYIEAVIERVSRYTWRPSTSELKDALPRPWSSEFGDAVGGSNRASLEIHLEAVIEWAGRWTCWPWLSEFEDMHLEAMIMWTWRT